MRFVILYRTKDFEEQELEAAQNAGFFCTKYISDIKPGDFCTIRYAALPFLEDTFSDIERMGGMLLNSVKQFNYCANLDYYYPDLEDFTFKTWFELADIPKFETGPFVLKGATNSKKFNWSSQMYAETREDATQVYLKLLDDTLIQHQRICIRKYEKLVTYDLVSSHKLPITKEFRIFICYGKIISSAFYWSNYEEWLNERNLMPSVDEIPKNWLQQIIDAVGNSANFYVIDVGQKENGDWICIELNIGDMSGLSLNAPEIFYTNLYSTINSEISC